MIGVEGQGAPCRLAGRQPFLGRFYAVIHGIAHQMHQGIADLLHHRLVQLGVAAGDHQRYVLVQLVADIPHHPLEAVEGIADGHHAQAQGTIADLLDQHGNGGIGLLQLAVP